MDWYWRRRLGFYEYKNRGNKTFQITRNDEYVLVVSDSCYSGTLTRSLNTDLSSYQTRVNYINKILEKETRILISSGGNEPVADSGGKKHSVLAQAFLEGLKNMNDNVFTAEELFIKQIREHLLIKKVKLCWKQH